MEKIVVFVGHMFYQDDNIYDYSLVPLSNANNQLEWNYIHGLEEYSKVYVLNSLPVGSYPKLSPKLIIKNKIRECGYEVGFINITFIKDITKYYNYKSHVKKIMKVHRNDNINFIFYDYSTPFFRLSKYLKKKSIKSYLISVDLPNEFGRINTFKGFSNMILHLRGKRYLKLINNFDGHIVLTKYMADVLNIQNTPYVVVEGMYTPDNFTYTKSENKILLYAGALFKQYDVLELIEAFKLIERDDVELWICGDGDAKNQIIEESKNDTRIKYLGFLSKNDILNIECATDIFINPRSNNHPYVKYSFPSKVLEYLSFGKPVITRKIDSYTEEYDKVIEYAEDGVVELKNKILEVLEYDDNTLNEINKRNKEFIKNNKIPKIQIKKVMDLINEN